MPTPGDALAQRTMAFLLAGGGVATYIASKAAVDALVGKSMPTSARLAVGHWLTIAVVALTALVMGEPNLAVTLVFASSVVCLTLGVGSLVLVSKTVGPTTRRPAAAMLLPAAMLAFLAGFHGRLTLTHAASLFLLGVTATLLWRPPENEDSPKLAIAFRGNVGVRSIQFVLAATLACVGGWAAVRGISRVHPSNGLATPGLLTVTLLAPLLVLPALGAGIDLAYRHRSAVAYDALAGVVLLNLCVLLPACIVEASVHPLQRTTSVFVQQMPDPMSPPPATRPTTQAASRPASQPTPQLASDDSAPDADGLVFPRTSWRVDAVALIVLAMMLLPVSLGRWPLTRGDGIGLVLGYLVYLLLAVALQIRAA